MFVNAQDTGSTACEYYEGFPEIPSINRDSWTSDSTNSSNLTQPRDTCTNQIAINQIKVEDVSSNTPDKTKIMSYKRPSILPPVRIYHEKASYGKYNFHFRYVKYSERKSAAVYYETSGTFFEISLICFYYRYDFTEQNIISMKQLLNQLYLYDSDRSRWPKLGIISGPLTFHWDVVRTFSRKEMQQETFRLLEKVNELSLTKRRWQYLEQYVLQLEVNINIHSIINIMLYVVNLCCGKLKDPGVLEKINWTYLECFRHLSHKRGLQFDKRLPKVVDVMISMRDCCEVFNSN
ncbi:hypothetical protein ACJMK2_020726 [Sinanodonta woodiana]|uniref:Uncharacterized protein n=1 Tax=Sinanodonta woodiana TaxID=1069815 RepID=A0ABD3U2A3_SINWO